jgi:hypothetical protein
MAAGDDGDDGEEEEQPVPRNRNEFYRLFNQKGPTNMICEFMSDSSLKVTARIVVDISYPLESSYYSTLKQVAEGWNSQRCWVSGRAVGEWLHTIHEITRVLESELFHDHLDMTRCMRMVAPPEVWPQWALQEQERLNEAYVFAMALAENWLWANIHFWLEFPSVIACVLHSDEEIATMAFAHMENLAKAVNTVERHERPLMKELLSDLGWNREQLARESMAMVLQGHKEELRRLANRLFTGTPSTKDCLENTFAFLKRKSQVHSTNNRMSDMSKYLYTFVSPYAESGGCPQILPSKSDLNTMHSPAGFAARQMAHRELFSPQLSLFPNPKAVPKPGLGDSFFCHFMCSQKCWFISFHGLALLFSEHI